MSHRSYHGNKVEQCRSCYKYGHAAEECRFKDSRCRMCDTSGHLAEDCPKRYVQNGIKDVRVTGPSQSNSNGSPRPLFGADLLRDSKQSMVDSFRNRQECQPNCTSSDPISLLNPKNIIRDNPTNKVSAMRDCAPPPVAQPPIRVNESTRPLPPTGQPRSLFDTGPMGEIIPARIDGPHRPKNDLEDLPNGGPVSLLNPDNIIRNDPTRKMRPDNHAGCPGPVAMQQQSNPPSRARPPGTSGHSVPLNPTGEIRCNMEQRPPVGKLDPSRPPRPLFEDLMGPIIPTRLDDTPQNRSNSPNCNTRKDPISLFSPENIIATDPTRQTSRDRPSHADEIRSGLPGPPVSFGHPSCPLGPSSPSRPPVFSGPLGPSGPAGPIGQSGPTVRPGPGPSRPSGPVGPPGLSCPNGSFPPPGPPDRHHTEPRPLFDAGQMGQLFGLPSNREDNEKNCNPSKGPVDLLDPKNIIELDPSRKLFSSAAGSTQRIPPIPLDETHSQRRSCPMDTPRPLFEDIPVHQLAAARTPSNLNDNFNNFNTNNDPISLLNPKNLIVADPTRGTLQNSAPHPLFEDGPLQSTNTVRTDAPVNNVNSNKRNNNNSPSCPPGPLVPLDRHVRAEPRPLLDPGQMGQPLDLSSNGGSNEKNCNPTQGPINLLDPKNRIELGPSRKLGSSAVDNTRKFSPFGSDQTDSQRKQHPMNTPRPLFEDIPVHQLAAPRSPANQNDNFNNVNTKSDPISLLNPKNLIMTDPMRGTLQNAEPRPLFEDGPLQSTNSARSDVPVKNVNNNNKRNNNSNSNSNNDPISLFDPKNLILCDPSRINDRNGPMGEPVPLFQPHQMQAMNPPMNGNEPFVRNLLDNNNKNNDINNRNNDNNNLNVNNSTNISGPISLLSPNNLIRTDPTLASNRDQGGRFQPYNRNHPRR